jgi:phenylpropionate dioxygenase-like ring-hydroxylating dioxygenase large terminal subunit
MDHRSSQAGRRTDLDPAALVRPDAVHRRVYTDPEIFALERERLFGRAWLFVGHESQVARTGDFFTTELAGQPVVMVRHSDGTVRVLFNRCGHRGAKVVAPRQGRAQSFVCGYHAWTFDTDGRLTHATAHQGARAGDFDMNDPCFSMRPVPRCASYRGFVFASLATQGPGLTDYLGGVLSRIDDMVDRAPDDALEIAGGCHRIVQNSNWKIFLENTHDGLHPMSVHRSSIDASRRQARQMPGDPPFALTVIMANNQGLEQMDKLSVSTFDWGHSFMAGFRNPRGEDAVFKDYVAALEARKGKARAEEILAINCHNAVFYPNVSVQPSFLQMRVIFPLAVDRTRIEMWSFKLKGAPEALFERTIAYANVVHSPSSLIRPDDVEAYERVQSGLHAHAGDWVSQHRDAGRDEVLGNERRASALSDLPMRNQYRAWARFMGGEALS